MVVLVVVELVYVGVTLMIFIGVVVAFVVADVV